MWFKGPTPAVTDPTHEGPRSQKIVFHIKPSDTS